MKIRFFPLAQLMCCLAVVVCLAVSGCGGGGEDQQPTGTVHGVVTYDGKPVPLGTITFIPTNGGKSASGEIQEDGSYNLSTYGEGDGAIVGAHGVVITAIRDTQNITPESPEADKELSLVPPKYGISPKSSGLTRTVKEGDNKIDFDLPK